MTRPDLLSTGSDRPDWADWLEAWTSGYNARKDGVPNDEGILQAAWERFNASGAEQGKAAAELLCDEPAGFNVRLTHQDADHLLAAIEWALNAEGLVLGPGLHWQKVHEAASKIEAVADLERRGVNTGGKP